MTTVFIILILIASIAMILVVLVQKSKGGGLSSSFSGSNAILGYKKTTDSVEKVTWGLAITIIALCIASVSLAPKGATNGGSVVKSAMPTEQSAPDLSNTPLTAPTPTTPEGN